MRGVLQNDDNNYCHDQKCTQTVYGFNLTFLTEKINRWQILLIGIATIFWIVGMAIWCAMGVIVANPPNGSKWRFCYSYTYVCSPSSFHPIPQTHGLSVA